jgi:hypothetical protein
MDQRYAVIQESDNLVVNVIMWDGQAEWSPPEDCFVVQSDTLNVGDTYIP